MKHQLSKFLIVALTIISFQLSARDTASYFWKRIQQGKENPEINFIHAVIAFGFGNESQSLIFMIANDSGQDLWIEDFFRGNNTLCFEFNDKSVDIGLDGGPGKYYSIIPPGKCSIEYRLLETWWPIQEYVKQTSFATVFWFFPTLNRKMDIGTDKIYLINSKSKDPYDFSSRFDEPDAVNVKIAKAIDDDNGYSFAFIVSNNTSSDIEIGNFDGKSTRITIKFPNGQEFIFPHSDNAEKVVLAAGKSVYKFFDLREVLSSSPDYSLDSLKYGISQLTLEVFLPANEMRSTSLPLVKFNQEPPCEPDLGRDRSLIKSPPTEDVFENNAFTLLERHVM